MTYVLVSVGNSFTRYILKNQVVAALVIVLSLCAYYLHKNKVFQKKIQENEESKRKHLNRALEAANIAINLEGI